MTLRIEPLDPTVARQDFCSGSVPLDRYFVEHVGQDVRRGITACFTATGPDGKVVGFYTLASCGIPVNELPEALRKKLPRYPTVPGILLGRLAISTESHGMGLGGVLLFDALKRCIASEIAAYALVADAIDDQAGRFYAHFGFLPFPDRADRFFLPLATARQLFVSR